MKRTLLVLVLALGGCELFANIPNGKLAGVDAGGPIACTDNTACAAPVPLCNLDTQTCVECLASPDCPAERSICESNACRGCVDDGECGSAVCLPDATCADAARVIYADVAGAGDCSMSAPCSLDTAATLLAVGRDIIKLAPGTYDRTAQLTLPANALVTGSAATMRVTGGMFVALLHTTGFELTVHRLTLDATGGLGAGCQGSGKLRLSRVNIVNGLAGAYGIPCEVTVDRTRISTGSFYGMYVMAGPATISNTYITRNGGTMSSSGGLILDGVTAGTIDHVTISGNVSDMMSGGLNCTNGTTGVAIRSSIIHGNSIDPACVITNSVVDPAYMGGSGNIPTDPMFVDAAANDYHLMPGSPVAGTADPASTTAIDFDGEPRPQPAGSAADPGADEIP